MMTPVFSPARARARAPARNKGYLSVFPLARALAPALARRKGIVSSVFSVFSVSPPALAPKWGTQGESGLR